MKRWRETVSLEKSKVGGNLEKSGEKREEGKKMKREREKESEK